MGWSICTGKKVVTFNRNYVVNITGICNSHNNNSFHILFDDAAFNYFGDRFLLEVTRTLLSFVGYVIKT